MTLLKYKQCNAGSQPIDNSNIYCTPVKKRPVESQQTGA